MKFEVNIIYFILMAVFNNWFRKALMGQYQAPLQKLRVFL